MRAKDFIVEYKLEKTVANLGEKLVARAATDPSAPPIDMKNVDGLITQVEDYDPSPNNQYVEWILRRYISGDIKLWEDIRSRISSALQKFHKLKMSKTLKPEHRDIGRIKDIEDIIDLYSEEDAEIVSKKQQKKKAKQEGVEFIIDEPKFAVVITKTYEANCFYGAGTRWCTAAKDDREPFDEYSKEGPLYVVLDNSGSKPRKYQLHVENDQFMDEKDNDVSEEDIVQLSKNPNWTTFLDMLIKKHYGKYLGS